MRRLWLLVTALSSSVAWAQVGPTTPDLRDLMQARNHAMGGAYEALGYGAEAVGGNPAALSLYRRYQLEGSGTWDPPLGFGIATLSVADSTNPIAAGISYHFATFGQEERRWAHLTTLALSYPIAEFLHVGLAGRHHVLVGATNTNSVSMNAGLIIKPVEFLTIGFSAHNLISVYNVDVPRYFVASIAGQFLGQLSPAFDLWMDFNQAAPRFSYRGGVEWLVSQTFPLRVGYQWDGIVEKQYLSGGVGWFVEGSGIDFAYRHELGGPGRMMTLTVKLQM